MSFNPFESFNPYEEYQQESRTREEFLSKDVTFFATTVDNGLGEELPVFKVCKGKDVLGTFVFRDSEQYEEFLRWENDLKDELHLTGDYEVEFSIVHNGGSHFGGGFNIFFSDGSREVIVWGIGPEDFKYQVMEALNDMEHSYKRYY